MSTRCPSCHTIYADDAKFCPRDGTKLETAAPSPPHAPTPHAPTPHAPPFIPPAVAPPPSQHARVF
ncbi:MAG: hypothetical protein M3Y30_12970, partial [Gemmatimonadota bacterium]|nr:hypothetical protein [Gemmatimonadota bacterium]